MRKRILSGLFSAVGIFLLIIDSQTAIAGARDGINICINSVVPSIFPFLVLSGILISYLDGSNRDKLGVLTRWMSLPQGSEHLFIVGLLGGYPTGAQCVENAYANGQITKQDAIRMLSFCNNAGPAFLFGILSNQFEYYWMLLLLWIVQILSAFLTGFLLPSTHKQIGQSHQTKPISFVESLKKSVITMGYICGWIILFRMGLHWMEKWFLWMFPISVQVMLHGFFELANGCLQLNQVTHPGLRFVIASILLSFGGICVTMQTASIAKNLNIGIYMFGKFIQCTLSAILSILVQSFVLPHPMRIEISPFGWLILAILVVILVLFPQYKEKNSRFPARHVV